MVRNLSQNKDILSQDEIDALVDKSNQKLNAEEKDVLGEIGNIAMGSAATALSIILDKKVKITTPEVDVITFSEIVKQYKESCVFIKVKYLGGIEGINVLIIKERDAAIIADLMMGGDGSNYDQELGEIQLSAVGEAMNQMMGSSSTAISSIINDVVTISPPETFYLNLKDVISKEEYFKKDEQIIDTAFSLKVGNLIDSSFKQLAPLKFGKIFASRLLKANNRGLMAEDEREVSSEEKDRGVKKAQFPSFDHGTPAVLPQNMELIQDVPLHVTVQLGKNRMTIKEILELGEGSIVELDKLAGEPVDLLVNGKLIAKGEVVVIDENFGFRVKDIISPMERINNI
jgi:flagellar motor switch protein FliN